jgi:hypothetical protein
MPSPVYADLLTRESEKRLADLVRDLVHPVALAGGHAVRLRVQDGWRARFGEAYFGSRDIDLAYLVEPGWSEDELRKSVAGQARARIESLGYHASGAYSFSIYLDAKGNELKSEPRLGAIVDVDYHVLKIDAMVTNRHELQRKVLGFDPIDEPLLADIFRNPALRSTLPAFGPDVYLPTAPVLIGTKLKSLPERTQDDKAVKDLCDLYALIDFGGARRRDIQQHIHAALPNVKELIDKALADSFLDQAARHLDIDRRDFEASIGPLALPA